MSVSLGVTSALSAAIGAGVAVLVLKKFTKKFTTRTIVQGGPLFSAAQGGGGLLFVSGQLGLVPGKLELVPGGVVEQTKAALTALKTALEKADSSMSKVLHTRCYLKDIKDYAAFNEVYLQFFADAETRPARVCFAPGGLPLGGLVEVECVALA